MFLRFILKVYGFQDHKPEVFEMATISFGVKSVVMPGLYPKESVVYFSHTQVVASFAGCVVQCAGVERSISSLPEVISSFARQLKMRLNQLVLDGAVNKSVGIYSMPYGNLFELISEICNSNVSVLSLNERNSTVGKGNVEFDEDLDSPSNFTDIGALSRNTVNEIVIANQLV